jgi:predicted membrane-bound mannosyltransferase
MKSKKTPLPLPLYLEQVDVTVETVDEVLCLRAASWLMIYKPELFQEQMRSWGRSEEKIPEEADVRRVGNALGEALKSVII